MNKKLFFKLGMIAILTVLLLIPLAMIESTVDERSRYKSMAKHNIAKAWSDRQTFVGPLLYLTYSEDTIKEVFDENLKQYVKRNKKYTWHKIVIPEQLSVQAQVDTQERYKGIYRIPVYTAKLNLSGRFGKLSRRPDKAQLLLSMQDMRGLRNQQTIQFQGQKLVFEPASNQKLLNQYLSAELKGFKGDQEYVFDLQTNLQGLDELSFVPAARQIQFDMVSNWQHPYFSGRYLPETRQINETGFSARWNLSHFSTGIQQTLSHCLKHQECASDLQHNVFTVGFHKPVDVYQQTSRAVKYGVLFILLTFIVFYLFECLKQLSIHPVQYMLVGCALAVFYLLLVSLSEHILFIWAYSLSALSCVGLIFLYLYFVFKQWSYSVLLAVGMLALYAMLYVILRSEDSALLMGSLLIFAALATLMMVTRHVDWYALSDQIAIKKNTLKTDEEARAC